MLAYVFWHCRKREKEPSNEDEDSYEKCLKQFHAVLNEATSCAGFSGSFVARITGAPWLSSDLDSYEDWYLIDGSEVLDRLNEVAVSGPCKKPHDAVARMATDFKGGLYQLKAGASTAFHEFGLWFSKPVGTTYDAFYGGISQYLSIDSSLWRRQMTLGPTPEFCLNSHAKVSLPATFNPIPVSRKIIWRKTYEQEKGKDQDALI